MYIYSKRAARLINKVYYKEVYFDPLYHVWFKKCFLRIVRTVVK